MSDNVDDVSQAFLQQRQDMQLCHDLMGGTETMRAAASRYLPLVPGQTEDDRLPILLRTKFLNIFKRTLRYLGGQVFKKQVALDGEDIDPRFSEFCENVDRMGQNLTVWSRKAFEHGLQDGVVFCLTDYSAVRTRKTATGVIQYQKDDGTWANRTESSAKDNGWRPYFILVAAESVLEARMEWKDGVPAITHFRYVENVEEPDGKWGTQTYQRIRAFYLDEAGKPVWEVWSNRADAGGEGAWQLVDGGSLSLSAIPVSVFMPGERKAGLAAQPALNDLAYLNLCHWQLSYGHANLLFSAQNPAWLGKCLGEFDPATGRTLIQFGPGKLCHSQSADASLESIGVDNASVESSRQALQDLKEEMAFYGLQLLQPNTGMVTATEVARNAEENDSTLKSWALQFQDFLENCFVKVANWWNLSDGPSVLVNTSFMGIADAQALLEFYRAGAISRQTLLTLARAKGALPDDYDPELETGLIEAELKAGEGPTGLTEAGQSLLDLASRTTP